MIGEAQLMDQMKYKIEDLQKEVGHLNEKIDSAIKVIKFYGKQSKFGSGCENVCADYSQIPQEWSEEKNEWIDFGLKAKQWLEENGVL